MKHLLKINYLPGLTNINNGNLIYIGESGGGG